MAARPSGALLSGPAAAALVGAGGLVGAPLDGAPSSGGTPGCAAPASGDAGAPRSSGSHIAGGGAGGSGSRALARQQTPSGSASLAGVLGKFDAWGGPYAAAPLPYGAAAAGAPGGLAPVAEGAGAGGGGGCCGGGAPYHYRSSSLEPFHSASIVDLDAAAAAAEAGGGAGAAAVAAAGPKQRLAARSSRLRRRAAYDARAALRVMRAHPSTWLAALLTALALAAAGALGVLAAARSEAGHRFSAAQGFADNAAIALEAKVAQITTPMAALASFVHDDPRWAGVARRFPRVAQELRAAVPNPAVVRALQLAPQGVVRLNYPAAENAASVGHDLLKGARAAGMGGAFCRAPLHICPRLAVPYIRHLLECAFHHPLSPPPASQLFTPNKHRPNNPHTTPTHATDPQRREGVLSTIRSGEILLQGPFKLLQGGVGLIARMPVFVNDSAAGPDGNFGCARRFEEGCAMRPGCLHTNALGPPNAKEPTF